MSKYIIITSINGITEAVRKYTEIEGWHVILVGDKKTPSIETSPDSNITYLSVEEQRELGFRYYDCCPFNHYSRKNLGYLYAIKQNAKLIADADDDNIPYPDWKESINCKASNLEIVFAPNYVNVYQLFTDQFIWPRGFPLSALSDKSEPKMEVRKNQKIAIWQGLADGEPDVDAIYRLVIGEPIRWKARAPIGLEKGVYCPINSQNTIWTVEAFPYLYLPASVSFRFTDILRGYIAQRGIWAMNSKVAFTSASVYQDRNVHDLMADFVDEIPCYTQIEKVISILDKTELTGYIYDDFILMYRMLFKQGIVKHEEFNAIKAWNEDLRELGQITTS